MDQIFVNKYIEKTIARLSEEVKQTIMMQTQLELAQQLINSLQVENKDLREELQKLQANLNKKAQKQPAKDEF